jgi:hypothetical protein
MSQLIKPEPRIFELPNINTQQKVRQLHERNAFCRQSVAETVLKVKARMLRSQELRSRSRDDLMVHHRGK